MVVRSSVQRDTHHTARIQDFRKKRNKPQGGHAWTLGRAYGREESERHLQLVGGVILPRPHRRNLRPQRDTVRHEENGWVHN
jgi:hypothetical protein